jgi:pimeloyl-ACP methyl ester carboxylesterase
VTRTQGRRLLIAAALIAPVVAACEDPTSGPSAGYPEWLAPCRPEGTSDTALCGRYQVWEDRSGASGRRISLNVLVLPATGADRVADPLFYFAGGPGASATAGAPGISRMLEAVHRQRDLVFIDVRGTGGSHALSCGEPPAAAPMQAYLDDFLPDDFVRACLVAQDANVALYSNRSAMADVEEVRDALGYERINLLGISGGTRAAQVYLRSHPDRVRTVVLKGVVPMDMENPLPHARGLEIGIRSLLDACAAEDGCRRAFPQLAADWGRSKQAFTDGPIVVELDRPLSDRSERVSISRGVYADGIRQLLYTLSQAGDVPAIIHAAGDGDFRPFARRELARKAASFHALSFGAFLSSTCAEDLRFVTEDDLARETAGTFLGDYRARRQLAACAIWGFGEEQEAGFQEAVSVDVPVLLISGEADPVTSVEGAERVAAALTSSRHVVFPNQAHDSPNPACESWLIAEVVRTGSVDRLDDSCARTTRRPRVYVP